MLSRKPHALLQGSVEGTPSFGVFPPRCALKFARASCQELQQSGLLKGLHSSSLDRADCAVLEVVRDGQGKVASRTRFQFRCS